MPNCGLPVFLSTFASLPSQLIRRHPRHARASLFSWMRTFRTTMARWSRATRPCPGGPPWRWSSFPRLVLFWVSPAPPGIRAARGRAQLPARRRVPRSHAQSPSLPSCVVVPCSSPELEATVPVYACGGKPRLRTPGGLVSRTSLGLVGKQQREVVAPDAATLGSVSGARGGRRRPPLLARFRGPFRVCSVAAGWCGPGGVSGEPGAPLHPPPRFQHQGRFRRRNTQAVLDFGMQG